MLPRRLVVKVAAVAITVAFYALACLPSTSAQERAQSASAFAFKRQPIPEPADHKPRAVRDVHPSLNAISAWISSVGAAVSLNDLDGDGVANDLCLVDPRFDTVTIRPVPGTGDRYAPHVLDPAPLAYDRRTMAPMGCVPGDLDEDGAMDVLVYYWGRTPVLFMKRANGFVPRELTGSGERWFTNAVTLADVDGDGHVDIVIANYFQDGARILDSSDRSPQAMQDSMSRALNSGKKHLFLWQGAQPPAFKEVRDAFEPDAAFGWALAVGAQDLDGDLLPELYVANDFGSDQLLHNRSTPGRPRFGTALGKGGVSIPASKVLGRDSFKGMGVDFGDLNDDGLPDIVVSNIATAWGLLESHFAFVSTGDPGALAQGVAPYVDASETLGLSRSGWGWDLKLDDFDNDGTLELVQATGFVRGTANRWPELQELATGNDGLLANPAVWPRVQPGDDLSGHDLNPFFVRRGDRYVDLAREVGLDDPRVTRGIATADVDGDGDLDMATASQWDTSFMAYNGCPRCGRALRLELLLAQVDTVQVRSSPAPRRPGERAAIGATVRITLPNGKRLTRQVDGGNGHSGRREQTLHFGLGSMAGDKPLPVEIRFRDATGQPRLERLSLVPGSYSLLLGNPKGSRP